MLVKCPFCKGEIDDDAAKCKHCGEWVDHEARDRAVAASKPGPQPAPKPEPKKVSGCVGLLIILGVLYVIGHIPIPEDPPRKPSKAAMERKKQRQAAAKQSKVAQAQSEAPTPPQSTKRKPEARASSGDMPKSTTTNGDGYACTSVAYWKEAVSLHAANDEKGLEWLFTSQKCIFPKAGLQVSVLELDNAFQIGLGTAPVPVRIYSGDTAVKMYISKSGLEGW